MKIWVQCAPWAALICGAIGLATNNGAWAIVALAAGIPAVWSVWWWYARSDQPSS